MVMRKNQLSQRVFSQNLDKAKAHYRQLLVVHYILGRAYWPSSNRYVC